MLLIFVSLVSPASFLAVVVKRVKQSIMLFGLDSPFSLFRREWFEVTTVFVPYPALQSGLWILACGTGLRIFKSINLEVAGS